MTQATGGLVVEATKECPNCGVEVPASAERCPICGYEFPRVPVHHRLVGLLVLVAFLLPLIVALFFYLR